MFGALPAQQQQQPAAEIIYDVASASLYQKTSVFITLQRSARNRFAPSRLRAIEKEKCFHDIVNLQISEFDVKFDDFSND